MAQLAAEAAGRSPLSAPRHAANDTSSRVGGLVERWRAGGGRAPTRRPVVLAAAVAGVLVAAVVAVTILGTRPEPERAPPLPAVQSITHPSSSVDGSAGDEAPPGSVAATVTTPTALVVSVVGTVERPGLITVTPGARVADAIESAGGADSDTDLLTVNLARRVADGEQIYVGVTPPPGVSNAPPAADESPKDTTKVDLNGSDQQLLETLPGVGEVTASRIVEWREEHGPFTSVKQLREIDGIGDKRFERLRDQVSVG